MTNNSTLNVENFAKSLQVELKGVITGSVEVAASADFRIKGKAAGLK